MSSRSQKRVEKVQDRDELSALIETVNAGAGPIEITANGKVAALLLSEKEYEWLCACAKKSAAPKKEARGLLTLSDENVLDDAAKQVASDFNASIARTAGEL